MNDALGYDLIDSKSESMLRVAVIGTETETLPLITSAERLPRIECARVSGNSRIEDFAAVVCCGFHAGDL